MRKYAICIALLPISGLPAADAGTDGVARVHWLAERFQELQASDTT